SAAWFSIALALGMLLASCATPTPAPTVAPTEAPPVLEATAAPVYPPGPEFIEIGVSIPLTGKFGSLGKQVLAGYEYAVADINAAGGVYVAEYGTKIPFRLTTYDDESDPTKAVSKMETLNSEQQVVAYLGGAATPMHAATVAIAEKNKVPYLGVSFAWWNIHQRGYKYLFSPFPKSPDQARDIYLALNELIPEGQRPLNVAIFQEKGDWGIELGGMLNADAKPNGYTVVYYGEYASGTTDFSSMILAAKDAGADALFSMPSTPDGIAMMKGMSELGWTPKFTMLIRAPDGATWGETLGPVGDYVAVFAGWHHGEDFPGVAELNAKHQADFGRPADVLVGPAYACVQILADAIERAGTLDRDAIRDAIADTDMMTVIGPVSFNGDGTGDVLNPLVMWIAGQQELVWPTDMATAAFPYPAPAFDQR
ncbi:MAG: amino acid ABC transporter substrate-binding protein, partial [Chloroflexi bacterium]|nr:amino acid ABC transporter substrate-binding protein [Chloroflexota bacterium]